MADDGFRAGERLALDWIAGKSELSEDLAALVAEMERPLGGEERGFLITIGNAARLAARREGKSAATDAPAPAGFQEATTPTAPTAPAEPTLDVDTTWRRARDRERRARLEQFARRNQEAWDQQRAHFSASGLRGC